MPAAAVFSLLVPALELGGLAEVLAGFAAGAGAMTVLDAWLPHAHGRMFERGREDPVLSPRGRRGAAGRLRGLRAHARARQRLRLSARIDGPPKRGGDDGERTGPNHARGGPPGRRRDRRRLGSRRPRAVPGRDGRRARARLPRSPDRRDGQRSDPYREDRPRAHEGVPGLLRAPGAHGARGRARLGPPGTAAAPERSGHLGRASDARVADAAARELGDRAAPGSGTAPAGGGPPRRSRTGRSSPLAIRGRSDRPAEAGAPARPPGSSRSATASPRRPSAGASPRDRPGRPGA